MKIIFRDLKHGVVKLKIESLDDLWYLSQVISKEDLVRSKTQRRVKDKEDSRSKGGERKTVSLSIRVEKSEFKKETSSFRISGTIEAGPEDLVGIGSFHTLSIDSDSLLTIVKGRWSKAELSRLDDAVKSSTRPKMIVASIDGGDVTIGLLRESGMSFTEFSRNVGGKYDLKGREERLKGFYRELSELLMNMTKSNNASAIVLSGPGFSKNNVFNYLRENSPDLASKCLVEDTGSSGRNGVGEVLKRGLAVKASEQLNSIRDARLMESVLVNIGNGEGKVAYGLDEVKKAIKARAVETLLVSDIFFFEKRGFAESLMSDVGSSKGVVHIVNSEGEAGKQLDSLGGVAALLRFPIS